MSWLLKIFLRKGFSSSKNKERIFLCVIYLPLSADANNEMTIVPVVLRLLSVVENALLTKTFVLHIAVPF